MKPLYLALLFFSISLTFAQSPYLVKDLDADLDIEIERTSIFSSIAEINGVAYYGGRIGRFDYLFRSDGTDAGTHPIKKISNPRGITNIEGTLYMIVGTDQLWKSDSTEDGTTLVSVLESPTESQLSDIKFISFKNEIYFTYNNKLWKTDGTKSGTIIIKTINPLDGGISRNDRILTTENTIYFVMNDGIHGSELWKSDGTEAGTLLVKDIRVGNDSSFIRRLIALDDTTIIFNADTALNGNELWISDGTEVGTVMLKNIYEDDDRIETRPRSSSPNNFIHFNGSVYFSARTETATSLWQTDGTTEGTIIIKDNLNISSDSSPHFESTFKISNNTLYFGANNDEELWKTDGTNEGTILVKNFDTNSIVNLIDVNSQLFFQVFNKDNNLRELWKTDGTELTTSKIKDVNPNRNRIIRTASTLLLYSNVSNTLFFGANNDKNLLRNTLWLSDGTPEGTRILKPENININNDSFTRSFVNFNGATYFIADDELWKTDGTDTGTTLIKSFLDVSNIFNMNDKLVFFADDDGDGNKLWKSDGTENGTVVLSTAIVTNRGFYFFDGSFFFVGEDPNTGRELWKSDGTEQGTVLVKDIRVGAEDGVTVIHSITNSSIFLSVIGEEHRELWKSDGTEQGTVRVTDFADSPMIISTSIALNNLMIFNAVNRVSVNGANNQELWKTDGTEQGTVILRDIFPGEGSSNASNLTRIDNTLYFLATDDVHGKELWKTDGTQQGTVLVKDIFPGQTSSNISRLIPVNNTVYFAAENAVNGNELWKSDGTEQGTILVKDINNGPNGSSPEALKNINSDLYFSANDGSNGEELWKTDGTEQGTILIKDINSGEANSHPSRFVNVNNTVFFTAFDPIHGGELWKTDGTKEGTVLVKDIAKGSASSNPSTFSTVNGITYFNSSSISNANFKYGRELMALGNCSLNNNKFDNSHPIENVVYNSEIQANTTQTCHCNLFNELISTTEATGNAPIVTASNNTVFIDETTTANFVKRHYEIAPQNNFSSTTGRLTLYFTQDEFNAFNALQTQRIPTSSTDTANATNIKIILREGLSSDGSGSIDTYPEGDQIIITPEPNAILWNATDNRWEVSFDTQGFGGFWLTNTNRALSTKDVKASKITLSPNPTQSHIQFNGLKQKESYVIYNMLGVAVQKGVAENKVPISTAQLTQGLYILELSNAFSTKIIKQ